MLGSVYAKTLRDLRGQTLVWGLGLAAIGIVNIWGFKSVQQMPGLISFLENLPPAFKALIGDIQAMALAEGFLRAKLFDALPLLLAVFAVSQGTQMLAGESEQKTIDLLMAQPVRRWRIALEKYLAVATSLAVMCVLMVAGLLLCGPLFEVDLSSRYLLAATVSGLPLAWLFTSLALLGSSLFARARQAALSAGIVVVASYVFEMLRLLVPELRSWTAVSVFAHHKAGYTLAGELSGVPILLQLGLAAVLLGAALLVWQRRDLA